MRVHHSSVATPHAATVDGDDAAAEDLGNDFGVGPHNIAALIVNTTRDSQLRLSPIGDPDLALSIDGSLNLSEELKLHARAVQKPLPSQALSKILAVDIASQGQETLQGIYDSLQHQGVQCRGRGKRRAA